jgi:hypothetical protein
VEDGEEDGGVHHIAGGGGVPPTPGGGGAHPIPGDGGPTPGRGGGRASLLTEGGVYPVTARRGVPGGQTQASREKTDRDQDHNQPTTSSYPTLHVIIQSGGCTVY